MPMVKPKLTFFQVEIESVLLDAPKTNKTGFCKGPETFYSIDM